ncbi:hypothetical protein [Janibacter corallicola]|uniref:hypothetical protein n=1 Tax=Janibacter corallicola TaxID=415212 RepID=UPI000A04D83C|nr:hypothetical protein [Janibacter corallicola]
MQSLDIRYSRAMAVAGLVVGILLMATSVLTQAWISLAAGAVLTVLGILTLVNPMVRITPEEVQLRNPLGMVLKRYPVTSPQDLVIDGKTLRHVPTNKRIVSLGLGINKDDVASLRAQLGVAS